jgi:hypothetical protein
VDRPKRPGRTKTIIEEELACVLAILDGMTDAEIESAQARGISYDERKLLTADQIRSCWQFDHGIHHAIGGPAKHWNFTPRRILSHRAKTHEVDRPQIGKTDRISAEQVAFQNRLLAKSGQAPETPVTAPRKAKGKIQSRGFQKRPEGQKHNWGSRKLSGKRGKVS